jgi:hypothetical protein
MLTKNYANLVSFLDSHGLSFISDKLMAHAFAMALAGAWPGSGTCPAACWGLCPQTPGFIPIFYSMCIQKTFLSPFHYVNHPHQWIIILYRNSVCMKKPC